MNRFLANLFQVFGASFNDQVGRGDGRKTVGRAGPATQTIIQRFLELLVPIQALLNDGAQKGQTFAGHAGLMPRRAEYRTGNLAKTAFIALGNRIILF